MAHEITCTNGKHEMAYTGETPWHGLGTVLEPGASIEQWIQAAGFTWEYRTAPLQFVNGETHPFPSRNALYRSDDGTPLAIVGDDYKIVQPGDILGFYADLAQAGNFSLETAGTLQGGRKVWALARIGESAIIAGHDKLEGYILLVTSCDTSLATQAELTTVRVVCNNTLTAALGRDSRARIRVPHSRVFRPDDVKLQLGIARSQFGTFTAAIGNLAEIKMTDAEVNTFLERLLPADPITQGVPRARAAILDLYAGQGIGSTLDGSAGTAWGLLNAITEYADHRAQARSADGRLHAAWFGARQQLKLRAVELLME
jgi:phage/plasmid-like protein (TIGR03299 family)